ncbi:DNA-binding protein [Bacillus sp. V3-13]|uniref:Mu transposase C-terminal domain-containing protein n=1 Tax=Bacillus sp. V3-13 TaxID=2053728 RepID=UPI000C75F32C|nr:Mu transposase C-terminal domain-containing protein [Bacillus sp. V3-13]PLR75792.1 DNA-binding protein [Bacillus sp. V3-13]
MNFFINEILQDVTENRLSRILWIDDDNKIAYIIDLNDDKALPLKRIISEMKEDIVTGKVIKLKNDPFIVNTIEEYTQKHIDSRDQAWHIIKEMVIDEPGIYEKNIRTAYIKKAKEAYGVSYPAVRKYLRKYWQRGKTINALLPDYRNSGARGKDRAAGTKKRGRPPKYAATGVNVDEKTKKLFRVALEKYYMTSKENKLTDAYKMMVKEFYAKDIYYEDGIEKVIIQDEEKIPSIRQFRYWYEKEYTVPESLIARKGRKKYNKDHRAVLNSSLSEVFGPGSRYQIDATVGDVYLISKHNPNWIIGRPVIYLVMDVFSRMVVGVYIGLEGPSWLGAMMALTNTVMDKQEFCAKYGIEISNDDWPCEHLPEILLADRGEFEGFNVDRLIEAFNLHVENAAPYRADWKGVVEKHFDLIQKKVKPMLPGYVDKDFQERGARDYRLDAVLTLDEFTKIIIKQILHYNQKHYLKDYVRDEDLVYDDVMPVPLKLWNWGIENRTGKLKYFPEDIVKLHLMPRETATVTYKGIRMKGIYYSCDRAVKESWFETARQKGSWKVEIAYDPRDMSIAYWVDSQSNEYDKCYMLEPSKRYEHSSLEEVIYLLQKEKQLAQSVSHRQLQKEVDYIAEVESIVANASKRKEQLKDHTLSKAEMVGSIKDHRRNEKQSLKSEETFQLEKDIEQKKDARVLPFQFNKENRQDFSRPNVREFLKRRKEKKDE